MHLAWVPFIGSPELRSPVNPQKVKALFVGFISGFQILAYKSQKQCSKKRTLSPRSGGKRSVSAPSARLSAKRA